MKSPMLDNGTKYKTRNVYVRTRLRAYTFTYVYVHVLDTHN